MLRHHIMLSGTSSRSPSLMSNIFQKVILQLCLYVQANMALDDL